jgi:hypothetical protein
VPFSFLKKSWVLSRLPVVEAQGRLPNYVQERQKGLAGGELGIEKEMALGIQWLFLFLLLANFWRFNGPVLLGFGKWQEWPFDLWFMTAYGEGYRDGEMWHFLWHFMLFEDFSKNW